MATTTTAPAVPGQLLVSISDASMLRDIKKAISMLKGVTMVKAQRPKPRLYDPETGEYPKSASFPFTERELIPTSSA